jgi:hypothetical protein
MRQLRRHILQVIGSGNGTSDHLINIDIDSVFGSHEIPPYMFRTSIKNILFSVSFS